MERIHIPESLGAKRGQDVVGDVAPDMLGVFPVPEHLLAVVAFREILHREMAGSPRACQLLFRCGRLASRRLRRQPVALRTGGLQARAGYCPKVTRSCFPWMR